MNETTDATPIFAPLWRRKWLILAVGLVVGVASYFYYKNAAATYSASTQVYLGEGAEEAAPNEKGSTKGKGSSNNEQALVINSIVVDSVRNSLRKQGQAALIHGAKVRAKAAEKSQFITISVEAHTARGAALLANGIAQAYIRRNVAEHRRGIERAISLSRRQLARIEAASAVKAAAATPTATPGSKSSSKKAGKGAGTASTATIIQEANLNTKINQLESSLGVTGPQQIKVAKTGTSVQLSPKPRKNAIFGFVIGAVLAAIAVYLLARFDRRLRTLAELERAFKSQVLAAFPKTGRPIVHRDGQPSPSRMLLEPLRRLDVALRLGDLLKRSQGTPGRIVLFMSPEAGDGKSALSAGLALILRDGGQRVAVVEANFRRPILAKMLCLDGAPGLADALNGRLTLDESMHRVLPIQGVESEAPATAGVAAAVESRAGSLFVLPGGGPVANPPALLAQPEMSELLQRLAADFDWVLIDAPSPLEVSDVMPLLGLADGIVIVARLGHTREVSGRRLMQLLAHTASAPVLGVAANCAKSADMERYGFVSPNGRAWPGKLIGR